MSELSVRITTRTEIDGRTVDQTIDMETTPGAGTAMIGFAKPAASMLGEGSNARIKVDAKGNYLPLGSGVKDHVAVHDHATGLIWSVLSLGDSEGDGVSQEAAAKLCADSHLLGYEDWRLPTRDELVGLVDDTRHEPAIDTDLFPGVKPRWHWTSTPCAWSSASAWYVHFYHGGVDSYHRDYDGFALAVRRAGQ